MISKIELHKTFLTPFHFFKELGNRKKGKAQKRENLRGKFRRWKTENLGKVNFKDRVKIRWLFTPSYSLRTETQTRRQSPKNEKQTNIPIKVHSKQQIISQLEFLTIIYSDLYGTILTLSHLIP